MTGPRVIRPADAAAGDLAAAVPEPGPFVILAIWRHPRARDTDDPARFILGNPAGRPFATWIEAHRAAAELEARGFINGGIAPVVGFHDARLPA